MSSGQRHTIFVTCRLKKHLQIDRKLISFHSTLVLCNFDLDLQITLTFLVSFSGIQAYRSNREVKNMSVLFDLDFNLMTLILKLDLDMIKMYLYTEN